MIESSESPLAKLQSEFDAESVFARKLFAKASKLIPSTTEIAEAAIQTSISEKLSDPAYLKDNFSELVSQIQLAAYFAYLEAERLACGNVLGDMLAYEVSGTDPNEVKSAITSRFFTLDRFFLSLTQSRRTRAGATFEAVVSVLFKALDYTYSPQPYIGDSRPDFVLPNIEHYQNYATDCLIFTCKRTLRERWRQVVTEGMAGQAVFLATIDERLSKPELSRMKAQNVIVVVPRTLKSELYLDALNVISFEDFFDHHLDPAIKRWKSTGVI
mgnify:CR=1 FL=1